VTLKHGTQSNLLVAHLHAWMKDVEGERFEFKEAKQRYPFEKLAKYCCALANEDGGRIILGVTDRRPRRVVGTQAFSQIEDIRRSLMEQIPLRIAVFEIPDPDGRVLVLEIPPRPVGVPIKYHGVYWARQADSLVPMGEANLRRIFAEGGHDFSAEVCSEATRNDLDPSAVEEFRRRWIEKTKNDSLATLSQEQLLRDAELWTDEGLTYACLILFGTHKALGRHLAQSEVIFEYRSSEAAGPAQQREEYREGFFAFYDDLWSTINLRNDVQHYEEGLFVFDIPTFAERSVREAVLNAVSHRNYQLAGSVLIRQYARRLVVESPGGFPPGITPENILDRQSPRNRRLADAFAKCGLVERSGQGMNLMFEQSISQGKALPELSGSDEHYVMLTLNGEVKDHRFVRCLEKIAQETQVSFDTHDFLVLDLVHREALIPPLLHERLGKLVDLGVVERIGRGRGTRYLLSRRFYSVIGARGTYTRKHGLDREENKAILLKHLRESGAAGCAISELQQVLTGRSRDQIKRLLGEMRDDGLIRLAGQRRGSRWVVRDDI